MQFVCDRCKAKYDIDEARLRGKSVKIRCRACGNILEVRDPNLPPGSTPSLPPPAPPRGRQRVATPIGTARAGTAAPPRAPAGPPPRAPASPGALGERFQQAFAGREVGATSGAAPPPASSDEATHIIATPFLDEAAKAAAAQEVARKLARWHVSIRNQPMGPMNEEAIRRHIESGEVNVNSLVWREGFDEWRPLGQVRDLAYLAELALKAAGGERAAGGRDSIFDLPPMQPAAIVQAPPGSPLQRWLVHAIVAVVSFALGMVVMYLVSDREGSTAADRVPASAGLPAVEEVATGGEALPTLRSGGLTIQLTNPTVVAEETMSPEGSSGTASSKGGGTRRSGSRSSGDGGGADAGTGPGPTGFLPGRDTEPIGGTIRTGGGAVTVGGGAASPRPLSAQQILPVVQAGQSGIQHCYNQARARDFIADLSLRLTIEISPDGSVRQATLTSEDYITGELESCIVTRVRQWQFPRATATSRVVLPFSFHQN